MITIYPNELDGFINLVNLIMESWEDDLASAKFFAQLIVLDGES
jgi:hypothetical protein